MKDQDTSVPVTDDEPVAPADGDDAGAGQPDLSDIFGDDDDADGKDADADQDDDGEGEEGEDDAARGKKRERRSLQRRNSRLAKQRDNWRERALRAEAGRGRDQQTDDDGEEPAPKPKQQKPDPSDPNQLRKIVREETERTISETEARRAVVNDAKRLGEAIRKGAETLPDAAFVMERVEDVAFYPDTLRTVLSNERYGLMALDAIGKSEKRIEAFGAMSPTEQVAHVAKLIGRFEAAAGRPKTKEAKPTPKAGGQGQRGAKDPNKMTQKEFEDWDKKTYGNRY
jgi:hypothetical protein